MIFVRVRRHIGRSVHRFSSCFTGRVHQVYTSLGNNIDKHLLCDVVTLFKTQICMIGVIHELQMHELRTGEPFKSLWPYHGSSAVIVTKHPSLISYKNTTVYGSDICMVHGYHTVPLSYPPKQDSGGHRLVSRRSISIPCSLPKRWTWCLCLCITGRVVADFGAGMSGTRYGAVDSYRVLTRRTSTSTTCAVVVL